MRRARLVVTANIPVRKKSQLENAKKLNNTDDSEIKNTSNNDGNKKEIQDNKNDQPENNNDAKTSEIVDNQTITEEKKNNLFDEQVHEQTVIKTEVPIANSNECSSEPEVKKPRISENTEVTKSALINEVASSPSKSLTNRLSFMRPVPRLDGHGRIRRNSIQSSGASASESEDDSRRNSTQTHSVKPSDSQQISNTDKDTNCTPTMSSNTSNSSNNNNNNNNNSNNNNNNSNISSGSNICSNNSKINMKQKRKVVVSESARKLAEAKREFLLQHEHKQPDRTKLTMYDLIYYNPTSNPMKNSGDSTPNKTTVETHTDDAQTDEDADDPTESEMPVPRVKVGPDGQLIIDEQSLVIERTGVKKNREAMAKRQALVDDDNNLGSGFYKRRKRVKEWSKWETIKFYKALSTIGTDFLLIQTLFPQRSRQDIKMKFKKEEKCNRILVEKALSSKLNFDMDLLKKELDTFDNYDEVQPQSESSVSNNGKARRKYFRRMAATSLGAAGEEKGVKPIDKDIVCKTKERTARKINKKTNNAKVSKPPSTKSSDCDDNDEVNSESDSEVYQPRATRSGRIPKPKKRSLYTKILDSIFMGNEPPEKMANEDENTTNHTNQKTSTNSTDTVQDKVTLERVDETVSDITTMEPGSLVIVSNKSVDEPEKTVVQVYMVQSHIETKENNSTETLVPVNIESEMLSEITNDLSNVSNAGNAGQ